MAHDAYLYFPSPNAYGQHPKGESKQQTNGIMLTDEWTFSLENKLNIGPHTMGLGAGQAQFQEFTIKKQVDSASADLFAACGSGGHFSGVELRLLKSTGQSIGTETVNVYLTWTFNMFGVEKIEWSYGDPAPEETVTFKFGVCSIAYKIQSAAGALTSSGLATWNQIKNSASPLLV